MPLKSDVLPALFAETVEQAPVAISITDADANIIYVNAAFSRTTGYAPNESLGRNESMLSDNKTPPTVYRELWTTLKAKRNWHGRLLNRHKDGHPYLADLTIAPILDDQGEATHYIGMHRDITDLYLLEQRVRQQKVLIETVVDSMPVAIALLDESGSVVLDNQMYKTLTSDLGLKEPATTFIDILREELGDQWDTIHRKNGDFRDREVRFDRGGRSGPRWYACAGSWFKQSDSGVEAFFHHSDRTYLLLTLTDITQQKRQEEEIRVNALKALIAEEEKIQNLRETLSAAIHHIQGPINLLNAATIMMSRRGTESQSTALLAILEQVRQAGEQSIAQLKKCIPDDRSSAVSPVNLNGLLHETIILLTERLLAAGIVVDWKPTPVLPGLLGRENLLRNMFKQVIGNAIDAMNHSAIVKRELRISTWCDGSLVNVHIEDTGAGIPDELRTKVFEPFYSTKTGGRAMHAGTGLSMAQDVVNQHAGLIRIDPSYHDGCRVHIQFDLRNQHTVRSRPAAHA